MRAARFAVLAVLIAAIFPVSRAEAGADRILIGSQAEADKFNMIFLTGKGTASDKSVIFRGNTQVAGRLTVKMKAFGTDESHPLSVVTFKTSREGDNTKMSGKYTIKDRYAGTSGLGCLT